MLGLELVASHPFGVGIGNQVFYSVQNGLYQWRGMTHAWEWEPVHNIYLLIATELGILGLAAFLTLLLSIIFNFGIRNFPCVALSLGVAVAALMSLSLMAFGLVDHFLWTLQPGRLMLWLVVGLALSWGIAETPTKE